MLSPAIKIHKFDLSTGNINASLINIDYKKTYKLEFSNINFDSINSKITVNNIDISNITNRSEVEFSYSARTSEDKFIFCKIFEWDMDSWKEVHIATAVVKDPEIIISESDIIQVENRYVGPDDKVSFVIRVAPDSRYDVKVGTKTFGIKTDKQGFGKLIISSINAVDYKAFSGKFVHKLVCKLIDVVSRKVIGTTEFEFVPQNLYALAATNDPDRPGCVILDPDPVASFSVTTDPFDAPCFPQPLVGPSFTTSGEKFADTTKLDPTYNNCNDGYVSSAKTVVEAACKIYHQPRFAKLSPPVSTVANDRISSLFESGTTSIPKSEWSLKSIGFVYSACDANASTENNSIDPCSFESQEIKKIPRIFLGCTSDSSNLKVLHLARGILKAPPAYFHSMLIGDISFNAEELENGDIVNVVFDLSSGERISKSLEYDEVLHTSVEAFIEAFASEISLDSNIVDANIVVRAYPLKRRIDVSSDTKFNIFAGQVNFLDPETGDYKTNDKILVIRDSKYTFDFEITSPADYDDIKNILSSGATHMLFLDSQFKGMTVSVTQSSSGGVIVLDTCPRVTTARKGLGSFVIESDTNCVHVAFINISTTTDANDTSITSLPFVKNRFNEVVPSSNPAITSFGHVFCQALVDGKWQLFSYFPGLQDGPWVQLTSSGENRNVNACSDMLGNVHLSWETDRFGYTSLQYACIGPSSKLVNRLALSGLISKQFVDELHEKVFTINPTENAVNFVAEESSNIELMPENDIISLVEGAAIGGGSFRIAREFTGYLRIEKDAFVELTTENSSSIFGNVVWPLDVAPTFDMGTYCSSYIIHFEQRGSNSGDTLEASFSAKFNGKILKVFSSKGDIGISNRYLRSSKIRYPSNAVSADSNQLSKTGSIYVDMDERSLDVSLSYIDAGEFGPIQIRVLVEGVKNQSDISQGNWNRIYSNNGKVSITGSESACIECSPGTDCAIAVMSVCQDHNGYFFQGQEAETSFSIHATCSVSPIASDKIIPVGTDLRLVETLDFSELLERNKSPYNNEWDQILEPIYYVNEFSGEPGFTQPRQYASKYKDTLNDPIVSFEDSSNRYFPGFFNNSNVQSFTISIYAGLMQNARVREINFQHPILALYVGRTDLENTDTSIGGGVANRDNLLQDQKVKISINKSRTKITISMKADLVPIDFSIRVVVSSEQFDFPFGIKDQKQINELYKDFVDGFIPADGNEYFLANNKFTIGLTEKRYDSIIPLLGCLKFDDININPNAIVGNFRNIASITDSDLDIDTTSCSDTVSINTFRLNDKFNLNGSDAHMHHSYVGIIPERVSFIAKNNEALDDYTIRTGFVSGYREAIIRDVYTGFGKVFVVINGVMSSGKRTSISIGTSHKISELPSVDLSSSFKIQVDVDYSRLSESDIELLAGWSHVSKESFFPPAIYHPNYHLLCNVFINDKPAVSHNAQIDLSDKTRQWDLAFGSPFGSYPVCTDSDASFLELMSKKSWEINFSNIRVGNPRVIVRTDSIDASNFVNSSAFITKLVPNNDSNIENESFEQSLIDPGDWVSLEHGSTLIDEWEVFNGGCIYIGDYSSLLAGKRSILLEACIVYGAETADNYSSYPQFKTRRGRVSIGQRGGLSQEAGTLSPGEIHQVYVTSALRQMPENFPKLPKIVMIKTDEEVFTYRHTPGSGEFSGKSSSLDFKTFRSEFTPVSSNFDIDIRSVSENLNNSFSYFPTNTVDLEYSYGNGSYTEHIHGSLTSDAVFYIDVSGALKILKGSTDGSPNFDSSEVKLADELRVVAIDSRIKFSSQIEQNPFAIAVTSTGFLQSVTYDETENYIPSFALQSNLPSSGDFINVSIGYDHGCGIKKDGTIVCWGDNTYGQTSSTPGEKFIQVKCGKYFTAGIKEDGSISCWGRDNYLQVSSVPSGKFIKIDAGADHAVGIKFDGTVVSWGRNAGTGNLIDPSTKLIDVAACGGTSYSLEAHPSTAISVYDVLPFNVGIDINGNIVSWGLYTQAFTANAREVYFALPSIPFIAIKRGLKSCILLGSDGKLYSYGITFCTQNNASSVSNAISVYRSKQDFLSGGPFVDSIQVYSNSSLIEEDEPVEDYRLLGMASKIEFNKSYGLPFLNSFSSIPLIWQYGSLQKSPFGVIDVFNKYTVAWEDNSQGNWGICESSNIWLNRSFSDRVYLSDKSTQSLRPSMSSDNDGKRFVVWESIDNSNHAIKLASHTNHPDYISDCDVDKIVSNSRLLGIDVDPYDPYNMPRSLMSCRVDLSFTASVLGNYFFSILFRDIDNNNIIYKTSSSKEESGKWLINGNFMSYDGQVVGQGETAVVSFIPDSTDDVFNKVLKVELLYSTEEISTEEMLFNATKAYNVLSGEVWASIPPGKYPVIVDGSSQFINEYIVFPEAAKFSSVNIDAQSSSYFELQGSSNDRNFIFPAGVTSLNGVKVGQFVKSFQFILGDDQQTSLTAIEATLAFNQPIVAVIIDENGMKSGDQYFVDQSKLVKVSRKDVVSTFQFYDGEYIRLDDDRKRLHIRFYQPRAATWPSPLLTLIPVPVGGGSIKLPDFGTVSEDTLEVSNPLADTQALAANPPEFPYATFRVIVSNSGNVSGQVTTTYFCATPLRSSCKMSANYTNQSTQAKDVHFKMSVYSDSKYTDALMSFSSYSNSRLWSNGSEVFPTNGINIAPGKTGSVGFFPPIIDIGQGQFGVDESSVNDQSRLSTIGEYYNLTRSSLICGVKYYIKAEATIDADDIELYRTSFICSCNNNLNDREDEFEWKSPRNDSTNTTIALSKWYIGNPSIYGTGSGLFSVAWEDSRSSSDYNGLLNRNNQNMDIYCAFIDSSTGVIDSAYNNGVDRLIINNSSSTDIEIRDQRMPFVLADTFGNFTIFSNVGYNQIIKRYVSVGSKIKPTIVEESAITTACSFTLTDVNRYVTAFDGGEFLQVRVRDKYVKGYRSTSLSQPIPIVNDCFIDLEVIGIPGAMAYKIRNESEAEFTDWIPINLPIQPLNEAGKVIGLDEQVFRDTFKGRWIANDIFTMPWVLSKSDGVKRVCIEVLTQFGKTQQFCLDIVAEYSSISYVIEVFYAKTEPTVKIFKPVRYKGIPVVNRKTFYKEAADGQSAVTISNEDLRSLDLEESTEVDVYIQVVFEDPDRISRLDALNSIASYVDRRKDSGSMRLSLYQQGSRIQSVDLKASNASEGVYYGQFKVRKNNGVTDKDGLAFVFVDLPSECLNPFVKNFVSILRLINDKNLDLSQATVIDGNSFIEKYTQGDKRNAFGSRRLT